MGQEQSQPTSAGGPTAAAAEQPPALVESTSSGEHPGVMAAAGVSLRQAVAKMRWTASSMEALKAAEEHLLQPLGLRGFDTDIGGGQHIHAVQAGQGKSEIPLVLCHGYGMGVGAWHLNYAPLASKMHVYAKDWLGCGLSSRPKWELEGVEETEIFFVDALERWRAANGMDKMVLCGHSLGGYLSVAYTEKYPERVHKLILASPVGVPEEPADFHDMIKQRSFGFRTTASTILWGWERGVTPGDVVRTMGPLGYRFMMGYANRRFSSDSVFDREAFGEYLYHNAAATHGSGERALSRLLKPGAWAKSPLHQRIPSLDTSVPVHFIYGDHDWMNGKHAQDLKAGVDQSSSNQSMEVTILPRAGHQLFLDNPEGFNAEIIRICRDA